MNENLLSSYNLPGIMTWSQCNVCLSLTCEDVFYSELLTQLEDVTNCLNRLNQLRQILASHWSARRPIRAQLTDVIDVWPVTEVY